MSPLLYLLLLLPTAFTSPLVYGTERSSMAPRHRPLILRPFLVPLARREPFVEQEEEDAVDEEDVDPPYEYRHAVPAFYETSPQYRFTAPYATYYERPPEMAYARPSVPLRRADPVEDLEEEMRQEEEWWDGQQEEEEAERAATDGAFLRNLILAQRYREDSLEDGLRRDSGDKAVRELESLAGKRSVATEVPPTTTPKGQKEVAVPASPPRRPVVGSRHTEERSVYAALEKLLQESSQRHRHQKRFVSNEDSMLEQLKQLKRA